MIADVPVGPDSAKSRQPETAFDRKVREVARRLGMAEGHIRAVFDAYEALGIEQETGVNPLAMGCAGDD